jgi:CRP-like cAMP-binding protein/predicted MFS family arabinose efflux permease
MGVAAHVSISPYQVFRNRNFSLMWSAQLISTMASAVMSLAASIYVFRLTNSALSVGLMLMATATPSLLLGLFAGVLVDRYDRKKIMVAAELIQGLLVFLIPVLVPFSIVWIYVVVLLTSAIGQFFSPAYECVLPDVASDEELASANSLIAISGFGSTAIGFAVSGLIASVANISWAFYVDTAAFVLAAACIYLMRLKPYAAEGHTSVAIVLDSLRTGVRELFSRPILRSLFTSQVPVFLAFGLGNALLLPFALRALGATEFQYGLQEGLAAIGFVLGSLLMAVIFDRMREGPWMAISYLGMALAAVTYSFLHSISLAIVVITISAFFNAPSSVGRRLIVQRNAPREMRGRVNSVIFVSRDVAYLLGMAGAGLADKIDVRVLYRAGGLILLLGAVLVALLPGLRQERAEWRKSLGLLRAAPRMPGLGLGAGRAALPGDVDLLVGLVPSLSGLTARERSSLARSARIMDVPAGATILRRGDAGDAAYFILSGRVVAGITSESGEHHSLDSMTVGDIFGEIAALTGAARRADVVATDPATLFQIPSESLRALMSKPALSTVVLAKMTDRLQNLSLLTELPRFAGYDPQVMRDIRTAPAKS